MRYENEEGLCLSSSAEVEQAALFGRRAPGSDDLLWGLSSGCVVEVSLRQATQEVHLQIPWIRKCQFMMTVFFLKEQQVSRA